MKTYTTRIAAYPRRAIKVSVHHWGDKYIATINLALPTGIVSVNKSHASEHMAVHLALGLASGLIRQYQCPNTPTLN
jgi:hypothetical protein